MKSVSGKEFCKLLEKKAGILQELMAVMISIQKQELFTGFPYRFHKNDDLKVGLLKSLMKIAEISEEELSKR